MRPGRIWAVARSDWALELKGRQGIVLPAILTLLLFPAASAPSPLERATERLKDVTWTAAGEVPPGVFGLADQRDGAPTHLLFFHDDHGVLRVKGPWIPADVRQVLDGDEPTVRVEVTPRGFVFPGRTMLFAMVSSSTLTGAVASSIGGERSRRTLVVLLSAAVSRAEVVVGKAFAWAAWGVGSSCLAAAAAILWGRVEPGFWLLPMASVPIATVSLGMWLVRSATDVVAGTATSLRALPAALAISAVVAFLAGEWNPLLGAAVPLGGALVAAGDTWTGWGPPFLAAATTLGLAAVALAGTVRDLEEHPEQEPPERALGVAAVALVLGIVCWWLPVASPLLWGPAGNPNLLGGLPVDAGAAAGGACLLAATLVRAARASSSSPVTRATSSPWLDLVGLRPRAAAWTWVAAVAVGAVVPFLPSLPWAPFEGAPAVVERMLAAQTPVLPVALLAIVSQELLFRGWVQKGAGPVLATLVWTAVATPLDPLRGLATGALLAILARTSGTPATSIVARLVALGVTLSLG